MKFVNSVSNLSQIVGGLLSAGTVPWQRILRSYDLRENAGLVTVLGSLTTIIDNDPSIPVVVDDKILFFGSIVLTKGATAGGTNFVVDFTGAGVVLEFHNGLDSVELLITSHPATGREVSIMAGIASVTGEGNAILRVRGLSGGSNGTVQAGEAGFAVAVIKGSL